MHRQLPLVPAEYLFQHASEAAVLAIKEQFTPLLAWMWSCSTLRLSQQMTNATMEKRTVNLISTVATAAHPPVLLLLIRSSQVNGKQSNTDRVLVQAVSFVAGRLPQ